jgi:hypothetical protein
MTNIDTTPSDGSLVLRGHTIKVDSDIGRQFAVDCVRFIEGLVSEEQLRKKYALVTDAAWRELSDIEPLQLLIGQLREKRIRSGEAQREKASLRWASAIDIVHAIVQDPTASAKHRLDGARELRACAGAGAEDKLVDGRDRIVITLNFGTHKVIKDVELKPLRAEERSPAERAPLVIEHEDEMPEPRPTGIPVW